MIFDILIDTADNRSNEPFDTIEDEKGDITGPQKCKSLLLMNVTFTLKT